MTVSLFDFLEGFQTITEDSLFAELGRFPKVDSARVFELVGRPKMFDNVPFFSEVTQDVRSFPEVTKDRTNK